MLNRLRQRILNALGRPILVSARDDVVKGRQALRYLALARLRDRVSRDGNDLTLSELSVFSQNGEDGVLHEILGRIGTRSRYFAEIGVSANEGNCILLADAFGWRGLFVDADPGAVTALRRKYAPLKRIKVRQSFITRENVATVLQEMGVPSDLDLLSIDVDGNDFWIWQAVTEWSPRVVIIEHNATLDPESRLVQPYDPNARWDGTAFFGASLGALRQLGTSKAYRLVHIELSGANTFFVRADLAGTHFLPEPEVASRPANYQLNGVIHPPPRPGKRFIDLTE